ncbi:MAG TPA: YceI family protein [Gemmatimonadales bacterium]|nr:YceI family protein [Gemmatimonadales bacterium]
MCSQARACLCSRTRPRRLGGGVLVAGLLLTQVAVATAQAAPAAAARSSHWVVDIVHSQIGFKVRHLLGRVSGTFTDWYGVILTDDHDWRHGRVNVTIQTKSLTTGNDYRDADLRSPRFFSTDSFPEIKFQGTGMAVGDSTLDIIGLLTIKGVTHPITLRGTYQGLAEDQSGHERIAFEASAILDRRQYGIDWNATVGPNTLIGNEVEITIEMEATRVR